MKKLVILSLTLLALRAWGVESATAEIKWATNLKESLQKAKDEKRLLFVDFTAEWCGYCKKLDAEVFSDDKVREILSKFVLVQIDGDRQKDIAKQYNVTGYPTLLVLDESGTMLDTIAGFVDKDEFIEIIEPSSRGIKPVEALEERLKANPDDGKTQLKVARRFMDLKQHDRAISILENTARVLPQDDVIHVFAKTYLLRTYMETGNFDKFETLLNEMEKNKEVYNKIDYSMARIALGKSYYDKENYREAIRLWEAGLPGVNDYKIRVRFRGLLNDAKAKTAEKGSADVVGATEAAGEIGTSTGTVEEPVQ